MSDSIPERADIRQLRTQAKELLRSLRRSETTIDGTSPDTVKLADAQLAIARKFGFDSWRKLVDQVETPVLIERFKELVESGDADALAKLLGSKSAVRRHVDAPLFSFDSTALISAAGHPNAAKLLPVLVRFGADPNSRSKWWAGGFSPLDQAKGETVDLLVSLGANFDVWSAAGKGRIEVLRSLLEMDPASVNSAGGDGERPLHFAANAEIAELLVERGADIEVRDVDHESSPIQYQINNPGVLKVLLDHGATADIFTAAVMDDVDLLRRILSLDPDAENYKVGESPFTTTASNGGHIYCYLLGTGKTPHHVAAERGSQRVLKELLNNASLSRQLVAAAWVEDAFAVEELLRKDPHLGDKMGADSRTVADAAQAGKIETVRLLLRAGVDPMAQGLDSGTALHTACWFGYVEIVRLLIDLVPLDIIDSVHGSPPLGWAAHGSHMCRNPKGDYIAVVETLLKAGADPNQAANRFGTSMIDQAGPREDVKAVLRQYGAR